MIFLKLLVVTEGVVIELHTEAFELIGDFESSRLLDKHHDKLERRVSRDRALIDIAVAKNGRNRNFAATTDAHTLDAFEPALNHTGGAAKWASELSRVISVVIGSVENRFIREPADIVGSVISEPARNITFGIGSGFYFCARTNYEILSFKRIDVRGIEGLYILEISS